ncbi:hypothetical protein L873DRAFT_564162 [Choiromyces venosus 120613-1]|uniref:Myb/SANT-like domain-containing protein n=1 Tax=Choiromyces venosus 120613-1 TaxID=1336337 RepID=A0A3N4JUA8_9PEZI|nr:hypothetical protein L873DRAFT_564162 [Choiromyces venosus 120613-1]
MKQKWKSFTHLLNSSCFGWDSNANIITASDSVWSNYLKNFPKAAKFKHYSLKNYHVLDEIFCGTSAAGSRAIMSFSSQLGAHNKHPIDSDELVENAVSSHVEDSTLPDEILGSDANLDWYKGVISYIIHQ